MHLGGQILKLSIVFKSARKNHIKIKEKREFLRKIGLWQNQILVFGVTLKQMNVIHEFFTGCLYLHFLCTIKFSKYFYFFLTV